MRWRFTWGQRWADGASHPPAKVSTNNSQSSEVALLQHKIRHRQTSPSFIPNNFQFMEIYHTKEEAAAAMALRRLKVKEIPLTMVVRLRLMDPLMANTPSVILFRAMLSCFEPSCTEFESSCYHLLYIHHLFVYS